MGMLSIYSCILPCVRKMKNAEVAEAKKKSQNIEIVTQKTKNRIGFRFCDLPSIVIIEVIRAMTIQERIKLALSSPTMELLLQIAKPKPYTVILALAGEESQVTVYYKAKMFCGEDHNTFNDQEDVRKTDMARWLNPELSTQENTINVYRRILKVFPTDFFKLAIRLTDDNQEIIREMLTVPDLQNFKEIMIYGENIDKEYLDLVMGTLKDDRSIYVNVKNIPDGYYHENMFKFIAVDYLATRWIKLDHLFSLRDIQGVKLRKTIFTGQDINRLIKYWVNSDHDIVMWDVCG